MRALVTGAAGFIGSHLATKLREDGHEVLGVDCFTPYEGVGRKRAVASEDPEATVLELDLATDALDDPFADVDVVLHLAGQPGVRGSWSDGFDHYARNNVVATQRVLEAAGAAGVARVVYASSSSVYGDALEHPTLESARPAPVSPYGVTKLAGEHLCGAYARDQGLSTVALRYFTVYGPRQRPDMALHRLFESGLGGPAFPQYGDGAQRRDITYVDDVVDATARAAEADVQPGTIINVAGGTQVSLRELIDRVGAMTEPAVIEPHDSAAGDVRQTSGATERAANLLGWQPRISLDEGLRRQLDWHRSRS